MATPSLLMIPSGTKAGKLYSVLPEDGTGDFTVSRNSVANRVNSAGLLESMAVNVPRLDYSDGVCPALLTEPQSTNLITYPLSFDNAYWTKSGATVVGGQASPSVDYPTSAFKLVESSANEQHRLDRSGLTVLGGSSVTCSIFAKKGERNWIILYEAESGKGYYFDLVNGVKGTHFIAAPESYSIEAVGSYWKISITSAVPSTSARFIVYNAKQDGEISYQGDGTSGVYIFGAQLEALSYPTSLIYNGTEGAQVTRLQDEVTVTPPVGVTSIVETIDEVDQTPITVIPVTYTVPFGNINKIIMT